MKDRLEPKRLVDEDGAATKASTTVDFFSDGGDSAKDSRAVLDKVGRGGPNWNVVAVALFGRGGILAEENPLRRNGLTGARGLRLDIFSVNCSGSLRYIDSLSRSINVVRLRMCS